MYAFCVSVCVLSYVCVCVELCVRGGGGEGAKREQCLSEETRILLLSICLCEEP